MSRVKYPDCPEKDAVVEAAMALYRATERPQASNPEGWAHWDACANLDRAHPLSPHPYQIAERNLRCFIIYQARSGSREGWDALIESHRLAVDALGDLPALAIEE